MCVEGVCVCWSLEVDQAASWEGAADAAAS